MRFFSLPSGIGIQTFCKNVPFVLVLMNRTVSTGRMIVSPHAAGVKYLIVSPHVAESTVRYLTGIGILHAAYGTRGNLTGWIGIPHRAYSTRGTLMGEIGIPVAAESLDWAPPRGEKH